MYSCSGLISLTDDESFDALSYKCDANDKVLQSKEINFSKFKHPATRVFQALRIYINEELKELEEILKLSLNILNNTRSRFLLRKTLVQNSNSIFFPLDRKRLNHRFHS